MPNTRLSSTNIFAPCCTLLPYRHHEILVPSLNPDNSYFVFCVLIPTIFPVTLLLLLHLPEIWLQLIYYFHSDSSTCYVLSLTLSDSLPTEFEYTISAMSFLTLLFSTDWVWIYCFGHVISDTVIPTDHVWIYYFSYVISNTRIPYQLGLNTDQRQKWGALPVFAPKLPVFEDRQHNELIA